MAEDTAGQDMESLEPVDELAELDDTQPEETTPSGGSMDHFIAHRMMAGAMPPAFNPEAHKEFYRFLLAGMLVFIGCIMPFGPQASPGYYSITGGLMLLISIGVIWSMWGAINTGRFRMKWILLMFFPFVWSLMHLISAFTEPAVAAWIMHAHDTAGVEPADTVVESWKEFFATMVDREDPYRFAKNSAFIKHFGPGKFFIFVGSLLAEFYLLAGLFGGIMKAKEKKPIATRRRR